MSRNLRDIYNRLKNDNPNESESTLRQRAWVMRDRMMFESSLLSNAAAAAAAGAGAGGGSGNRRTPVISTTGQSILYSSFEDGVYSYFIYNFNQDVLTDIKNIELPDNPSRYPVTRGGFFLSSYDSDNENYKFLYLNLNGDVVWQDTSYDNSNYDIEVFSRYIAVYYLSSDGQTWKLEVFDENSNQRSFAFDNFIEGGGYSYDDVWSGGFIVREDIGTIRKFFIINFELGTSTLFVEIDTDLGESISVYQYAFSDKIFTRKNSNLFEIWSSSGEKLSEFDIVSEFATSNWFLTTFAFLDENGSLLILGYDDDNNENNVVFYSGVSNQFSSKVVSDDFNYDYEIDGQRSYIYTSDRDPKGSALIKFYDNQNQINNIDYYGESYFLPVWATDTELRDLYTFSTSMGAVSISGLATTRSEDYINVFIDGDRGGLYLFSDYPDGSNDLIDDGGDDMYDTGNIIKADDVDVQYTHTQYGSDNGGELSIDDYIMDGIVVSGVSGSVFGTSSEYFTNLYPGLFVLAAQNTEIDKFEIDGNLGSDGDGEFDTLIYEKYFNSSTYSVFVKRVWDAGDPSVNHIIIVNSGTSSITQVVDESNEDDTHVLTGLSTAGVTEIYYLLLALRDGAFLENNKVEDIVDEFLNILDVSSDINELLTNLNQDYTNITDVVGSPDENYSLLRFNRVGEVATIIPTDISKSWEYGGSIDKNKSKSIIRLERPVEVNNQTYGFDDLSDVEDRFYYSLDKSVGDGFTPAVENSLQLVMKDVTNDQYWAIQFTEWGDSIVANFAWTRQLIVGGTFSGEVISFTFSGWEDGEADIISPGVLEIRRSIDGDLYNSVSEGESNNENPRGTLWNSEFSFITIDEFQFSIIGLDGNVIDSVVTSEDYSSSDEGNTFILEDEVFSKTWISNNSNGQEFQLLNDYYTEFEDANDISNELGLRTGYFIIKSGLRYRFVSEDSISEEVIIPSTGENFTKINSDYVFHDGFLVISEDELNYNFYFYDVNANLISQKTLLISEIGDINDLAYGKRSSIKYESNGLQNVILFNGSKIIEVNTNLSSLVFSVNDYNWWND
jgi:hypothetical protein